MILRAHAKTNLVLSVKPGADATGFHEVRTVMCSLELADEVQVDLLEPGRGLVFSCEPDPLPPGSDPSSNIAWRAAAEMAAKFGRPLDIGIHIVKSIPSQAGLGGGSSDAAAVLKGLARLWGISSDDPAVVSIARSLGADVAYFLNEVPAYLDGRGDVLRETFRPLSLPVVLVKPQAGVSTGACYRLLDEMAPVPPSCAGALAALRADDAELLLSSLGNNMQPPARCIAPELNDVFEFLDRQPELSAPALLCGSGSCVAAFVRDDAQALSLAARARDLNWWSCATRTLG